MAAVADGVAATRVAVADGAGLLEAARGVDGAPIVETEAAAVPGEELTLDEQPDRANPAIETTKIGIAAQGGGFII